MKLIGSRWLAPAHELRIALALKGIAFVTEEGTAPAILEAGERRLSGLLPIIAFLDERVPEPSLLGGSPADRRDVDLMAQAWADLPDPLALGGESAFATGLQALCQDLEERLVAGGPGIRDRMAGHLGGILVVAALYRARRLSMDLEPWHEVRLLEAFCLAEPAFILASPDRQNDRPAMQGPSRSSVKS